MVTLTMVELIYALAENGLPYVRIMIGVMKMPVWYAGNWDTLHMVSEMGQLLKSII